MSESSPGPTQNEAGPAEDTPMSGLPHLGLHMALVAVIEAVDECIADENCTPGGDLDDLEAVKGAVLKLNALQARLESNLRPYIEEMHAKLSPPRAKGKKLPAKYWNPKNSAQGWSGRGQKPKWVVEALKGGATLESLTKMWIKEEIT